MNTTTDQDSKETMEGNSSIIDRHQLTITRSTNTPHATTTRTTMTDRSNDAPKSRSRIDEQLQSIVRFNNLHHLFLGLLIGLCLVECIFGYLLPSPENQIAFSPAHGSITTPKGRVLSECLRSRAESDDGWLRAGRKRVTGGWGAVVYRLIDSKHVDIQNRYPYIPMTLTFMYHSALRAHHTQTRTQLMTSCFLSRRSRSHPSIRHPPPPRGLLSLAWA